MPRIHPKSDPEAVRALALLRGVALETRARLADEAPRRRGRDDASAAAGLSHGADAACDG